MGICAARAQLLVGRLGPLADERQRQVEVGRDLLGAGGLKHFAQDLVGLDEPLLTFPQREGKSGVVEEAEGKPRTAS